MKARSATEIFLSHSSKDRKFAEIVAAMLRKRGLRVWYSPIHIVAAQQWQDEIGHALARCNWFLLILSRASIRSMWVKRELSFALQDPRYQNRIVPVLFQDCQVAKLSWTLSGIQTIDFRHDREMACAQLLRVWGLTSKPNSPFSR